MEIEIVEGGIRLAGTQVVWELPDAFDVLSSGCLQLSILKKESCLEQASLPLSR